MRCCIPDTVYVRSIYAGCGKLVDIKRIPMSSHQLYSRDCFQVRMHASHLFISICCQHWKAKAPLLSTLTSQIRDTSRFFSLLEGFFLVGNILQVISCFFNFISLLFNPPGIGSFWQCFLFFFPLSCITILQTLYR